MSRPEPKWVQTMRKRNIKRNYRGFFFYIIILFYLGCSIMLFFGFAIATILLFLVTRLLVIANIISLPFFPILLSFQTLSFYYSHLGIFSSLFIYYQSLFLFLIVSINISHINTHFTTNILHSKLWVVKEKQLVHLIVTNKQLQFTT